MGAVAVACSAKDSTSECANGGASGATATEGGAGSGGKAQTGGATATGTSGGSDSTSNGGASGASGETGAGGDGGGGSTDIAFVPSNVPVPQAAGLGDVTLTGADCVIDTDDGTIDCLRTSPSPFVYQAVEQDEGGRLGVFAARSFNIEQSAQVRVMGSLPLVLVALTQIDVLGGLDATAKNTMANGGGFTQTASGKGGGPGGGTLLLNYDAAGGGAFCGKGGDGGVAAVTDPASRGGTPFGTPELVPLFGGASGGGGVNEVIGGAGGGAIELVAGTSIRVGITGVINVGGGGGRANGGAAGSGGAILLEAPQVTVNGTLSANGGGGAIYNGGNPGQSGQPGITAALGSTATAGIGSADATIAGGNGTNTGIPNSSGGGGGGAGRIRINTSTGAATLGANAVVSPSLTTACATQGVLGAQ
ncbi:MAG: hypothetical protein QM756_25930 [Polyangiaceae bacterium]